MLKKMVLILLILISVSAFITSCSETTSSENTPPVCNITNPLPNETITIGDEVTIYGYTMDNDGQIISVEFHVNDELKDTDYLYPYSYDWNTSGLTEGAYEIKVTSTDDGDLKTSDNITVNLTPYILFKDDSLNICLSEILNISIGNIKPSDVDTLKSLKITHSGIKNLSGFEFFKALEVLDLDSNNIYSISPLEKLYEIDHLSLAHNNISDINPLTNLKALEVLDLDYNNIEDIKPLEAALSPGDSVSLLGNPLNSTSIDTIIPLLINNNVIVNFGKK